ASQHHPWDATSRSVARPRAKGRTAKRQGAKEENKYACMNDVVVVAAAAVGSYAGGNGKATATAAVGVLQCLDSFHGLFLELLSYRCSLGGRKVTQWSEMSVPRQHREVLRRAFSK